MDSLYMPLDINCGLKFHIIKIIQIFLENSLHTMHIDCFTL